VPEGVEICAVEIPGRGRRFGEPPFKELGPLIAELVFHLEPFFDRSFSFYGHSMGGLLAFELTRALRRSGKGGPEILFVSALEPPHRIKKREKILHELPDQELLQELEKLGGTPPEVLRYRELMELFLPVVRADLQVLETYRYSQESLLGIPLTVFGGQEDKEVSLNALPSWAELTTGPFSLHSLPGDHFFIRSSQEALLTLLSKELAQTSSLS
jgi:medium-chain acyl-[acyl-carrier-protein] hydrolase